MSQVDAAEGPRFDQVQLTERERVRLRRRTVRVLVAGVALGSTGHIAAVTVAPIVASELTGTPALSGVPGAAVVLGAAVGASALSALMARRGRRPGISAGYGLGVIGAVIAIGATVAGPRPRADARDVPDRLRQQLQPAVALRRRRHVPVPPPRGDDRHDRLGRDGRGGARPDADRAVRGPRGGARAAAH